MAKIKDKKTKTENPTRQIKIEKVVLSVGGTAEQLEKGVKLLNLITGKSPSKRKSHKRIPAFGVRPKLEVGAVVTIRQDVKETLKRMLTSIDNKLKKKQMSVNNFSFGIKEYIEIPGMEYQRDIGIMGLDVTVVFKRQGRRVGIRKMKTGKVSARQRISKEEIIKFMEENFQTDFS
nr:50S ribosomal protein L5P, large subunit ribosomal protein L5 [uncultured archaeon]